MSIYQYGSYVAYLKEVFPTSGPERGRRSALVKYLGCQTSFISQVLGGRAHLAMEHAIKVAEFLRLSAQETDYFITLVQKDRAGSKALRDYFEDQLDVKKKNAQTIRAQVMVEDVPSEYEQYIYYSSWIYAACHILCALPEYRDRNKLRSYLGIEASMFEQCIDFLKKASFIEEDESGLSIKRFRVHVDAKSPMIDKHHVNWRIKAIEQIEKRNPEDFHFSGIYGIARKDAKVIHDILLNQLKTIEDVVKDSKEDSPYILLLDFWNL